MIKLGTKVYRNIQEQVAKNTDDIAQLWRRPVFQIVVVEELPEEGVAGTLYLVPAEDPEQENIYEEYLWVDNISWELIGTTAVDISNMVTTDTDQTITGLKTTQQIDFLNETGTVTWSLFANTVNGFEIRRNGVPRMQFTTSDTVTYTTRPYTDNTSDLGTSARRWKDLYLSGNANVGSKLNLSSTGASWSLQANGNNNGLEFAVNNSVMYTIKSTDVSPSSTNARDLGTSALKWKNLYLSGNLTDSTNSVSVADLAALITYAKAQGWIS